MLKVPMVLLTTRKYVIRDIFLPETMFCATDRSIVLSHLLSTFSQNKSKQMCTLPHCIRPKRPENLKAEFSVKGLGWQQSSVLCEYVH